MITALVGLPPFPGFWAKWQLIMLLASGEMYGWIALILIGSLLEAAYLFRWFSYARQQDNQQPKNEQLENKQPDEIQPEVVVSLWQSAPIAMATLLLFATGYGMAIIMQAASPDIFLPLVVGFVLWLIDATRMPLKNLPMLVAVAVGG